MNSPVKTPDLDDCLDTFTLEVGNRAQNAYGNMSTALTSQPSGPEYWRWATGPNNSLNHLSTEALEPEKFHNMSILLYTCIKYSYLISKCNSINVYIIWF
jgi:hypothetical protein